MSGMTGKGVIFMDIRPQEVTETCDSCPDYPLGGSLEPYDIWHEMQILEKARRALSRIN